MTVETSTYHQATVEADLGVVLGQVQVFHHLVHVGKDLGERDGVDEPDGAQGRKLSLGKRRLLGRRGRLLVLQSAVVIEGVIIVEEGAGLLAR